MKKALFLIILTILAVSSFSDVYANDLPNRRIFIEGTSVRPDFLSFFSRTFQDEAIGTGYPIANNRNDAAYIFRFNVTENHDPADDNQYVIKISLVNNADNEEVLTFDFFFSTSDQIYEHSQSLFLRASSYIPPYSEDDLIIIQAYDNRWRNKWIYLRASFDYPIRFYALQPTGLLAGKGVYSGESINEADNTMPLHHVVIALPGATAGLEFQLLNFLSLEVNFQMYLGDPEKNMFYNMALGAELKIPLKFFRNIMIVPYGAFSYPLNVSPVYNTYPLYAVGGGAQLCARGGRHGAFFVDIKFLMSFSEAVMHNRYGELYPNPEEIYYNRYMIGLGIGYKLGFFNRK